MASSRASGNHVVLLVIGGILALLGGSCEAVGCGMAAMPNKRGDEGVGLFFMLFSAVVFVLPAALLLVFGFRGRQRVQRMDKLAALGASSVRLPIDVVASDLGVSPAGARELILQAVGEGILRGRLDLDQGAFLSSSADANFQQAAVHCRRCGASAQVVVVPGQHPTCPYCKSPI